MKLITSVSFLLLIFEISQQFGYNSSSSVKVARRNEEEPKTKITSSEDGEGPEVESDESNISSDGSEAEPIFKNKSKVIDYSKNKRTRSDFAAVVVLAEEKLSLIIGNKVWYYVISDNTIQKYPNNGPKDVTTTEEKFPHSVTGSLAVEDNKYYFFRDDHFCMRKIEIGVNGSVYYSEEESIEVYKVDEFGNKKLVSMNNLSNTIEAQADASSMCIWKSNSRLFGCLATKDKRLEQLCKDPTIFGALGYNNDIYIFTPLKVYIFDGKYSAMYPFGELVSDDFQPQLHWKQFDASKGGYFALDDRLYLIKDNKFTSWNSKGDIDKLNELILDADECLNINGAAILLPNHRIAVVVKHQAWYYKYKNGKIFKDSDTNKLVVEETSEKLPHSITGSFTPDFKVYYFFRGSKYCYREPLIEKLESLGEHESNEYFEVYEVDDKGKSKIINQTIKETMRTFEHEYSSKKKKEFSKCIWKDNTELFGCSLAKKSKNLQALCSKPSINGIVKNGTDIYVFANELVFIFDGESKDPKSPFGQLSGVEKPSDKWKDFSPKENGFLIVENQMHIIFPNETSRSWKPDGTPIYQMVQIYTEEKYAKISKLVTNTTQSSFRAKDPTNLSPGTAVVLPLNRIALVIGEEVWYYREKGKKIIRDSEDNGPKPVMFTVENFPPYISAAFSLSDNIYYFFRGNEYCKRPLIVDKDSVSNFEEVQWQEVYQVDKDGNKKLLNRTDESKFFKVSQKDSHCIWRENTELFGCQSPKIRKNYQELCANSIIIGTVIYDKVNVYLFVKDKVYIFNTRSSIPSDKRPSNTDEYIDPKFVDMIAEIVNPSIKWIGFNPNDGKFFANNNDLYTLIDTHKFSCWSPDGKKIIDNQPIEEPEKDYPDEPHGKESDSGALINSEQNDGKYVRIRGDKVFDLFIEDKNIYLIEKLKLVYEDEHKNPIIIENKHIIAAIKSMNANWYFINSDGKYCKRSDKSYRKCKEWLDNERIFGCKVATILPDLMSLCENTKIIAGGNYPPYIFVFRGGKYWQFDNKPKKKKPFGNLIEGGIPANNRWPGIHFPGNVGYYKDNFVIIYENSWSQWKPNGEKVVFEALIEEKNVEYLDEPEGDAVDSGALIPIGRGTYGKVHQNKVCYLSIKNNKYFWNGNCVSVKEDENYFPPDIIAAIKSKDKIWYFFNSKGKYCKRLDKEKTECKEWNDNKEVFGCKENKMKPGLRSLCDNPRIAAGSNYPPYIYVFRGGKYWKFNNKPKPDKPFGELIEGGIPAKNKWPGIHFPGAISYDKNKLIIVYNNKWSLWKPNSRNQSSAELTDRQSDEEYSDDKPDKSPKGESSELELTETEISDLHPTRPSVDENEVDKSGSKEVEPVDNGLKPIDSSINVIRDQTIRDEEISDEPNGNETNEGALIISDDDHGRYVMIKDRRVCTYTVKDERLYLSERCTPIEQSYHKYPPNIVAVIKSPDKKWYFFNKEGKYCKRADKVNEECTEWQNNREVFGCNIKPLHPKLESLCDNVKINAGGNYPPFVLVFRGGKYWQFDNQLQPGKPFGNLVIGGILAKYKWPGIEFPGGLGYNQKDLIMIYDKTWSRWHPNGDNYFLSQKIVEVEESRGTAVVLPNDRIAVVIKDQVWYYRKIGNKIVKDSDNNGPKSVKTTVENLPPAISAAFSLSRYIYYFFKGSRYCKRPLILDQDSVEQVHEKDWQQSSKTNIDKSSTSEYFMVSEIKSYCVWRETRELFGCDSQNLSGELRDLCANPITIGTMIYDKMNLYFFTNNNVYIFDTQSGAKSTGSLGSKFHYLRPGSIESSKKWIGFDPKDGRFFAIKNELCVILKDKYSCWDSKGKQTAKEKPVGEPEPEASDEPDGDDKDAGALIYSDNDGKYTKIKDNEVCYFVIEDSKLFTSGKCVTVKEDHHKYPSNIIAAIKTSDFVWYYVKKYGKYCKREDKVYEECHDWRDNKELFGCNSKLITNELRSLCDNPKIIAGGNYASDIYIIRGGKYWKFDNNPKRKKPLGNLVEGPILAKNKWPGIHFPGCIGNNGDNFIIINGKKWSQWALSSDKNVDEHLIGETKAELPDELDGKGSESGALVPIDVGNRKYAKISRNRVCYLVIKNNTCYWTGKCLHVNDDDHNFPPNIIAAIKSKDKDWYYFDKKGKYCKRPETDVSKCKEWNPNEEVFGCGDKGSKKELEFLCNNPRIIAGSNYPPNIYVFKSGKYWVFNNEPKPNKPFGDLLDGGEPAINKWPGIHFPGGTSFEKMNFIIVYKNKWSRWRPNTGSNDSENPIPDDSDEASLEPIGRREKGRHSINSSSDDNESDGTDLELIESSSGKDKSIIMGGRRVKPTKSLGRGLKPDINDVNEELIHNEKEVTEETGRNSGDAGDLISTDQSKGKFAKVSDNKVCYLIIEPNKAFWDKKCMPISKDKNKFPPNIIASIKAKDGNNYFFDKNGKYCNRPDNSYEKCTEWNDNSYLFGCNATNSGQDPELQSFCKNSVIKASTDFKNYTLIFRNGKQWKFDNKPKQNKPFGEVIDDEKSAKSNWTGTHFPGDAGPQKNKLIMIYKKKWSQWTKDTRSDSPQSDGDVRDESTEKTEEEEELDNENDYGALVIVDETKAKYAKIKMNKVCYIVIKDNKANWDGDCVDVNEDPNRFPPNIVAAIKSKDKNWFYFDKEGKYCKRSDEDKHECTQWKDSKEVFGCNEKDPKPELEALCTNTKIEAGTNLSPFIYVIRGGKYWKFNNIPKPDKPFGDLIEGAIPVDEQWPGIHFPGGSSYNSMALVMVYGNKWAQWKPNDDSKSKLKNVSDEPISDGSSNDSSESEGDENDLGALISIDENKGQFAKIKGNQVCYLIIKNDKAFWDGKCKPVNEDKNNYPPNIVAAVKGQDEMWYYFSREGKYCKRADKEETECTEWKDSREAFGCNAKDLRPELESLCKNPKIKAGGNYPPNIYVYRDGKYWKFNNKPKPNKPLGDVIEGDLTANDKWQGIHISGGSSYYKKSFVMVYKNKWSLWISNEDSSGSITGSEVNSDSRKVSVDDVYDDPIMNQEQMLDGNDENDSDSGALIIVDERSGIYAKIKGNSVCYLVISNNRCNWIGKCKPVTEDENKFPPNIYAAVKARDKSWYFFDKNGKHCRRSDKDKSEVTAISVSDKK